MALGFIEVPKMKRGDDETRGERDQLVQVKERLSGTRPVVSCFNKLV
jgi:hypothetical protein